MSGYNDALKKYEKKLKIVKDLNNQNGVAYTLSQIGVIHEVSEEYGKALRLYEESFKINEEIGNQRGVSRSLYNMAYIHYFQGAYAELIQQETWYFERPKRSTWNCKNT
jgi:tetratricopeptide (TPR) repeat protein